jgi:hypothetical protein
MVLISLQPFVLRKLVLIVAALLFFSAFCFADPVFMARQYSKAPLTASSSQANPLVAARPSKAIASTESIVAATFTSLLPGGASVEQPSIRSQQFVSLQLENFAFSDLNPSTASDLTTFQ